MWSAQKSMIKKNDRILYSGGLGTMGYAIPAAIGASFAAPDQRIVAICGDGGFQMSLPELQTIMEFKIPLKIIVINNEMLGLMKNFQDENFGSLYVATVIDYSVPNITKLADVYGLKSRTLFSEKDVYETVAWFNNEKGPLLLEVKIARAWAPYPKVLPGSSLTNQHPPLSAEIKEAVREILR